MKTSLCLLFLLRFASPYRILTRSMIHGPEDVWRQVPLKTKEDLTTERIELSTEGFSGRSVEDATETPEEYDDAPTTEIVTTQRNFETNRTKLFPVGRLWERTQNDIWSILTAALGCIWSGVGMDCFTYRVVPMFKSFMGYEIYQPPFLLPRSEEGRGKKHIGWKMTKIALITFFALKGILLPILAGLALISGKALFLSILSSILTAAAAWTSNKNADRRVQTETPIQNYYM